MSKNYILNVNLHFNFYYLGTIFYIWIDVLCDINDIKLYVSFFSSDISFTVY